MKVGQKVRLRKYEDYKATKTEKHYGYVEGMVRCSRAGIPMEITYVGRNGELGLASPDGDCWTFHIDDVITEIKLENK